MKPSTILFLSAALAAAAPAGAQDPAHPAATAPPPGPAPAGPAPVQVVVAPGPSDPLPPPPPRPNVRTPLAAAGGALAGLGALTLFAAGVTWLVAWSEKQTLDSECPDNLCVEGTTGGDNYETARDAGRGAEILVGVGMPVLATGIVLLLYASALGSPRRSTVGQMTTQRPKPSPIVAGPASLRFQF